MKCLPWYAVDCSPAVVADCEESLSGPSMARVNHDVPSWNWEAFPIPHRDLSRTSWSGAPRRLGGGWCMSTAARLVEPMLSATLLAIRMGLKGPLVQSSNRFATALAKSLSVLCLRLAGSVDPWKCSFDHTLRITAGLVQNSRTLNVRTEWSGSGTGS